MIYTDFNFLLMYHRAGFFQIFNEDRIANWFSGFRRGIPDISRK
jgi:hypothetical protein